MRLDPAWALNGPGPKPSQSTGALHGLRAPAGHQLPRFFPAVAAFACLPPVLPSPVIAATVSHISATFQA